jgi:hypothetical protein
MEKTSMIKLAKIISVAALTLLFGAMVSPAYAQADWSAMPAGCASTDNNFYSGTPNSSYPVARFAVPGGTFTFNQFHDGYIAVVCNVDNPRVSGALTPTWNQLQVTYRDPDGLQGLNGAGTEYQTYVELVRVAKSNGAWSRIASFDSNLLCAGSSASCHGTDDIKTITVPFTHTFDFNNYTYAVYGRLYRGIAIYNLRPVIYQLRLQVQPPVIIGLESLKSEPDGTIDQGPIQ